MSNDCIGCNPEHEYGYLCASCRRQLDIGRAGDKLIRSAFAEGMELGYKHGFGCNLTAGAWTGSKSRAELEALTKGKEKKHESERNSGKS